MNAERTASGFRPRVPMIILLWLLSFIPTVVTCPSSWSSYHDSCYFLGTGSNVSNMEAQILCANHGAYLASIHSDAENSFIFDLTTTGGSNAWIGLYRTGPGKQGFANYDRTPVDYTNWRVTGSKEPNNFQAKEYCAHIRPDKDWNDAPCQKKLPAYICKKPVTSSCDPIQPDATSSGESSCDDGWSYFNETDSCYFIGNTSTTFNNTVAQSFCRAQNAYLASIHSDAENSFIQDYVYTIKSTPVWIGTYRIGPGLSFANYDGTPLDYTKWNPGEPNFLGGVEYCTEMYISGLGVDGNWNDRPCDYPNWLYACKKPAK